MRLTDFQRDAIRSAVIRHLPDATVLLYGSRTDDAKRGGDIDLLVLTRLEYNRQTQIAILMDIIKQIGERKIDLLIRPMNDPGNFAEYLLPTAIAL